MDKPLFSQVEFKRSIKNLNQQPSDKLPEISFIGRSNVGKSSLLNAICGRKNIAKVSSTPGKTQLINYFLINNSYYFVDLPGYGYAKLPNKIVKTWQTMIEDYLLESETLKFIILLIDARHKAMAQDLQMIEWLNHHKLPYALVLTKADKISGNKIQQQLSYYKKMVPDHNVLIFSTKVEQLKRELSEFILHILI
ncbi:MAG: ribosome biogenesis GTP-binding protein YihA/YsxC [Calditrichaceae bacterium]